MRVVICDDEREQLVKYKNLLQSIAANHDIPVSIVTYSSGDELLFKLEDPGSEPDLIFMDIMMPGTNGVDTATKIRQRGLLSEIIFLTVRKEFALDAFDVDAMHYIVKEETSTEKFERIFLKAYGKIRDKNSEMMSFTCAGENRVIPVSDILYFEVKNYVITVHYVKGEFEFYSTLGKIENTLLGHGFRRVHRSFLVNEKAIRAITRNEITMSDGETMPVGRSYWKDLQKLMPAGENNFGAS